MRPMKTVTISSRSRAKLLHIEAPGCIVNIEIDHVMNGHPMTLVSVQVDGDRYAGDPEWWVDGVRGNKGESFRIVQVQRS